MFQIHKINNGYLVAMPPSSVNIGGQPAQPQTVFAENFTAVMLVLKANWPTEETGSVEIVGNVGE